MNAHSDFNRPFDQTFDPRLVLAAVRQRLAARLDFLVARWLQRCAAKVETAQRVFETERKPANVFGMT
jgi:hypothetical protein